MHRIIDWKRFAALMVFLLSLVPAGAEIYIGGDVYGGGSKGIVGTDGMFGTEDTRSQANQTNVVIRGGTIMGSVYGGGEMADVYGGTHVNLDGANASDAIVISNVYGGNDKAGEVTGDALVESTYGASETYPIYVNSLFGGGNGDYDYSSHIVDGEETNPYAGMSAPDIAKTTIQLLSGCYHQVFGGGNKATVTSSTTIRLIDSTATFLDGEDNELLYQFDRVFGGNNLTAMAIRPTWDLQKAVIKNLYSGGNAGDMTSPTGIVLAVQSDDVSVNNLYGGCRMADVNPAKATFGPETDYGVSFPANYAARVLVTAGKINNVYGGNDISGNVYGGNAIEIRSSIVGDVYGGGNGSYNYTDNADWVAAHPEDEDFFYAIPEGLTSAEALNEHRPNAESVFMHVVGTESDPTYIGGALYCGGNSATLKVLPGSALTEPSASLKIGSYVVAKNAFLGSNGVNMVTPEILETYADSDFSGLQLTVSDNFEEYMRGAEVSIKPSVSFDNDYVTYSTKFGSLYCGGNVGSMSAPGFFDLSFLQSLVIYEKLVGGCNNANVAASDYNAAHEGGLITHADTKVILNVAGVKFEPKTISYDPSTNTFSIANNVDADGYYIGGNIYGGCYSSGYVNGDVEINITAEAVSENAAGATHDYSEHAYSVFNTALSAFGGGYGKDTEIRGNTSINIYNSGHIVKAYGGGEMGVVKGNTMVNIMDGSAEILYAGGFEGPVEGNTALSLNGGTVSSGFGGACNADIKGYSEVFLGNSGNASTVTANVFGGNDFGGSILGLGVHEGQNGQQVKSNTYVLYNKGAIGGGIYGGSYGNYDYSAAPYSTKAAETGFKYPSFLTDVEVLTADTIGSNSFVDLQVSNVAADKVAGNIYGGGYGSLNAKDGSGNQMAVVDMEDTYVLLRSANKKVSENILGGGYYSVVNHTRVDAYSGYTGVIYGGTYGATAATAETPHMDPAVNYACQTTEVNVFNGINRNDMDVFGGGSYAGAVTTQVNLYGGTVRDVYGGSNMEGVCLTTNVCVPGADNTVTNAASTAVANAIYGGGFGGDDNLPCDVLTSNIDFESATAYVGGGVIYGGNNRKRATKVSKVNICVPVKTAAGGSLASVCGGGNGLNTITGYTHVNLNEGAEVRNVYGGGRDGEVFGYYDNKVDATDYYNETDYPRNVYAHWAYTAAQSDAVWTSANADGVEPNTNIVINEGAKAQAVYGAGYGAQATVSGNTYVCLNGGYVSEDIYGGGYSGNVYYQTAADLGTGGATPANQDGNVYTFVDVQGGSVRNVYGGGFNGNVGNDANEAETRVSIGSDAATVTYAAGDPAIRNSVYGGGYKGAVIGTAYSKMFNGHVGYAYDGTKYEENLNYEGSTDNLLKENGNFFGGGFGEGATVDHSDVAFYGGILRNSLYGGGEIAAIGRGSVNGDKVTATITQAGSTSVQMYGGLVVGDVFGGGRGYAIDAYGNTKTGEIGYSDGYTFGTTYVGIHRGTIGTASSVADGQGNVFGGGNIGYVYTATGTKSDEDGYYYNTSDLLTEDIKVVISPECVVTDGPITIGGVTYQNGDYVPTEALDLLASNASEWAKMDNLGITIGNAIFAGGNVSAGSDRVYANAKTVFGNATASVTDVFNKDYITIGDDGIGGLYGDGNLTFVDGYRELNISNYGTDYYNLNNQLTYEQYLLLTDRERAYFELQYQSTSNHTYEYYQNTSLHNYTPEGGEEVTYKRGQKVTAETFNSFPAEEKAYWEQSSTFYGLNNKIKEDEWNLMDTVEQKNWELLGFCTLYAGRMVNTIQRADFCGVFGSRIVLRGAQDRVPSVVDYTNYTINRVKEVSLNQQLCPSTPSDVTLKHGNYFGIYNVVNYLGALTSDVDFYNTVRTTTNGEAAYAADGSTFSEWKQENLNNRKRNNGTSANEVALASGVWLEIVSEETEENVNEDGEKEKIYGPITGVVELTLINVSTGEGGGYVYAKNVHGERSGSGLAQVTLTAANEGAVSQKQFVYSEPEVGDKMQTSGNFINPQKRIVDDCYPDNGLYFGEDAAPAHYWYIRGEFYIYDQYISAYTGSSQAYAETVSIPLTITAESQGKLQLESINENLFAYWEGEPDVAYQSPTDETAILVGGVTYHKSEPISYWAWSHLTADEQLYFAKQVYSPEDTIVYNGTTYPKGEPILPGAYNLLPGDVYLCTQGVLENGVQIEKGDLLTKAEYEAISADNRENFRTVKSMFHPANAVSHDNGFLLTFDWDNPEVWNDYYKKNNADDILRKAYYTGQDGYIISPTFNVNGGSGVFGQVSYTAGDLIDKLIYDYQDQVTADLSSYGVADPRTNQATFEVAYIAKANCSFTVDGIEYNYVQGAPVAASLWDTFGDNKGLFEPGYICTQTYQISESEIVLNGDVMTNTDYAALETKYGATVADKLKESLSPVYICSSDGKWGGSVFVQGRNYEALKFCNLYAAERENFYYNYDALDLLSEVFAAKDADVKNGHYQGNAGNHARGGQAVPADVKIPFCEQQSIDYTATFEGAADEAGVRTISGMVEVLRNGEIITTNEIHENDVLTNVAYEGLVNEQFNYTALVVAGEDETSTVYYLAKESFQVGDIYYCAGKQITEAVYDALADKSKVATVTKSQLPGYPTGTDNVSYYFCCREYQAATAFDNLFGDERYETSYTVPVGEFISKDTYQTLMNEQTDFRIDGRVPTETSTLYVSRETDIKDLSQDKIITVAYWYEYIESDETGSSYETIREQHIVNVHVHFESGVPSIGELLPPSTVLPGTAVGLNQPTVSKGAYEILGGGWEIFANQNDAQSHKNGAPYVNNSTKMYWYQDGYYVAYYAKSYLGKTYSNPVQFSVANFHRMDEVMSSQHQENVLDADGNVTDQIMVNDYMYLDNAVNGGKRNPKVYINSADELSDFNGFFQQTLTDAKLSHVEDCANLEFFLQADIDMTGETWTSVGSDGHCFSGNFHGDGYTIGGLDHSLFGNLCGNVYNTGVTGSFTGAGIAETGAGRAVNCWVATSATPSSSVMAVLGNPTGTGEQIVNCYYPEIDAAYSTTANTAHGVATMKPVGAFLNGEVAYDLNEFYLTKRYYDGIGQASGQSYNYWILNADGTRSDELQTAYYPVSGVDNYVEARFEDGDFIYADGYVPVSPNLHDDGYLNYYPVYPDDYIFFGQNLSFDADHDVRPTAVLRITSADDEAANTKLLDLSETGNRVYRAPAYYGSKQKDDAHFNPSAVFTATYSTPDSSVWGDNTYETYKKMTAIDFTGYNDASYSEGLDGSVFYAPVLDYFGLKAFETDGLTQNLLAYIPAPTSEATDPETMTNSVLADYFYEPTLSVDAPYSTVKALTSDEMDMVKGHVVQKNGEYVAHSNQFLVDLQDFNCPIEYTFDEDCYMWHQRTPENYVENLAGGWESISLPFKVETVTTQTKGELTHFFGADEGTDWMGHEYWLRGYDHSALEESEQRAYFARPSAGTDGDLTVDNDFLWDYYYSANSRKDANTDIYKQYYDASRTYEDYPYMTAGTPYLLGLPGATYYEFDLSGQFQPAHTATTAPAKLSKQTLTFISFADATVEVSDDEYLAQSVTADGYVYRPTYQTYGLASGDAYLLADDGSQFSVASGDAVSRPFRPYFTEAAPVSSVKKYIAIAESAASKDNPRIVEPEPFGDDSDGEGALTVYAHHKHIYLVNGTDRAVKAVIYSSTGKKIGRVTVEPASRSSISVNNPGIYFVDRQKVIVK